MTAARSGDDRRRTTLGLVLSGGGARAAYQVGVLRGISRLVPSLRFDIVAGVSAGALNATFLASHRSDLSNAAEELTEIWSRLESRYDTAAVFPGSVGGGAIVVLVSRSSNSPT